MNKINLLGLTKEELELEMDKLGEPSFRAQQILNWVYGKKVFDFSKMSNLAK
ncbi:MAG: hypothetical protein R6V17_00590 [Halanaerobacter sp.]